MRKIILECERNFNTHDLETIKTNLKKQGVKAIIIPFGMKVISRESEKQHKEFWEKFFNKNTKTKPREELKSARNEELKSARNLNNIGLKDNSIILEKLNRSVKNEWDIFKEVEILKAIVPTKNRGRFNLDIVGKGVEWSITETSSNDGLEEVLVTIEPIERGINKENSIEHTVYDNDKYSKLRVTDKGINIGFGRISLKEKGQCKEPLPFDNLKPIGEQEYIATMTEKLGKEGAKETWERVSKEYNFVFIRPDGQLFSVPYMNKLYSRYN